MNMIVKLSVLGVALHANAFDNPGLEMETLIVTHVETMNQENFEGTMKCFHSQTPGYPMIAQMTQQLFSNFDLAHKLISFRLVGRDGEYALASVTTESTKISGGMFANNRALNIYIFKEEYGEWKIWAFMTIESRPI